MQLYFFQDNYYYPALCDRTDILRVFPKFLSREETQAKLLQLMLTWKISLNQAKRQPPQRTYSLQAYSSVSDIVHQWVFSFRRTV